MSSGMSADIASNGDGLRLTGIRVRGLHSLADLQLEFDPNLTILAGPNASGKSNIVDAVIFVADALYDGVVRAVDSRGGAGLLHRHRGRRRLSFRIQLSFQGELFKAHYQIAVAFESFGDVYIRSERISIYFNDQPGRKRVIALREGEFVHPRPRNPEILQGLEFSPDSLLLSVMGDSPATAGLFASALYRSDSLAEQMARAVWSISSFVGEMRSYHLFPNMMRVPRPLGAPDTLVKTGANLATVLNHIVNQGDVPFLQLVDALAHVVPDVGNIRVRETGGYQFVELRHGSLSREGWDKSGWLDLSRESDGTVRALGLLTALYQDPRPALMAVEEPEMTIHVGVLGVLADALKEISQSCQLVVTTHSSDLLDYFSPESIRAVEATEGQTEAGSLKPSQLEGIRRRLVLPGEIHRIEGLSKVESQEVV